MPERGDGDGTDVLTFCFAGIPSRSPAETDARTHVIETGIALRPVTEAGRLLYQIDVTHALSIRIDVETGSRFDAVATGCRTRTPFTPEYMKQRVKVSVREGTQKG